MPFDAVIPDSLSYKKYNYLKDSVSTIRTLKNGDYFSGSSVNFFNLLGTGSCISCDTCSLSWYLHDDNIANRQYYIKLPGWGLKIRQKLHQSQDSVQFSFDIDSVQFYVNHGQAFVRKIATISSPAQKKYEVKYHLVDEPVKFRYSQRDQCLMIMISESVKNALDITFGILSISGIIYVLYLLRGFLDFILDLSKGLSFTDQNVKRLKVISLSLLIFPFSIFLLNLFIRLIFYSYFTKDVVINDNIWSSAWKTLVAGIVFYMLYKAFKQGKLLKEEQDFTV